MKSHSNASLLRRGILASLWITAISSLPGPAAAHHPTGKKMPATVLDGFLSGIGHPLIGPDHLAFIVAIGIAAALVPAGSSLIAAFVATSTVGVLLHALTSMDVPLAEPLVAISVIAAGALVAFGRNSATSTWMVLAAVAGLFHGYAFGETVVGAGSGVIGAYLIGLALVASAVAVAAMQVMPRVLALAEASSSSRLRAAGAVLAGVGLSMLASNFVVG